VTRLAGIVTLASLKSLVGVCPGSVCPGGRLCYGGSCPGRQMSGGLCPGADVRPPQNNSSLATNFHGSHSSH